MKYKVAVTDWVFENLEPEKEILAAVDAEVVAVQAKTADDLLAIARDADGILNTYFGPIDEGVIGQLEKCKIITRYGIGVDTIDIPCATKHGVVLCSLELSAVRTERIVDGTHRLARDRSVINHHGAVAAEVSTKHEKCGRSSNKHVALRLGPSEYGGRSFR